MSDSKQSASSAEAQLELIIEKNADGMLIVDYDGIVCFANPAVQRLFGREAESMIGMAFGFPVVSDERAEIEVMHRDGSLRAVEMRVVAITWQGKEAYLASLRDITVLKEYYEVQMHQHAVQARLQTLEQTREQLEQEIQERKQLERRLSYLARHDVLTGLANRLYLRLRFERVPSPSLALLYMDLDHFKIVNDSLGHSVGDELLVLVAKRLRQVTPESALLARMGGDEFAMLLPQLEALDISLLLQDILGYIHQPFLLYGRAFQLGVSIGVVFRSEQSEDFNELMRRADLAMYAAKAKGGGVAHYSVDDDYAMQERLWLESALQRAIANKQLHLVFQPIINLKNWRYACSEVLLRWQHPQRGAISPGVFIPIAEASELISQIDRWVLCEAVQAAKRGKIAIAVNLSPKTLYHPDFVSFVEKTLQESGLAAGQLRLELTERVFASPEITVPIMEALERLGVHSMLDDFGTGYSSLLYLQHYPFSVLKLDGSFIKALEYDKKARAIAETVAKLAHDLGILALAEGVETEAQLSWCRYIGFDFAQGYYISRPLDFEALTHWYSQELSVNALKILSDYPPDKLSN